MFRFDNNISARIRSVERLYKALTNAAKTPIKEPRTLSQAQRARLILLLRALDGKRARTSHREIAAILLDREALKISAVEWTNTALRKRINRIIDAAQRMTNGGYLQLVRGDIERAKRFRRTK